MKKILFNKNILKDIDIILLSLIFVELVIYPEVVGITIIIYFISLFVLKKLTTQYRTGYASIFLIILYLLHLISLLWTDDLNKGLFDLEVKLSLFIFPIFIGYLNYSKEDIEKIFVHLSNTWLIVNILLIFRSILNYFFNHQILSYNEFTYKAHPTYFSMYSVFFITYYLFNKNNLNKKHLLYILIYALGILLSSSKAGFIGFIILIFIYLFKYYRHIAFRLTVGIILVVYFLFYKTHYLIFISDRIRTSQEILFKYFNNEPLPLETNSIRLYAWKASINAIAHNWMTGVGIGDTHRTLNQYYIQKKLNILAEKNINAHNVFLQIILSIGITGLLLFFVILLSIIRRAYINKINFIMLYLLILIFMYFSTESILETQAGTVFIGLFFSLFDKYLNYKL